MDSRHSSSTTDSPNAEPDASSDAKKDADSSFEKWLVRFFLLMAFGVAFGIEGMTLFRSYVLDRDSGQDAEAVEAPAPELPLLQVGDEVLPDAPPAERIEALSLEARPGDTWIFRMTIALQNPTKQPYELTTFGVLTRSGSVHEEAFRVTCPPGDSTQLRAEWQLAPSDLPESIVASGRIQVTPDSAVVHARRFRLPRIPVQMVR
jgi:hypothetical protein